MKKTLERLKKDALNDAERYIRVFEKLWEKIDEMSKEEQDLLGLLTEYTPRAVISLLRYIQALEDYGYELDKAWDRLLKSAEQVKQKTSSQKKPFYVE